MGHRLCHFLMDALPRHPSYMQKDPLVTSLREKSLQSLVHVQKRLEALALRIDEEQLNKYIVHDFDPFADDDDDDDDDEDDDIFSHSSSSSCSDLLDTFTGTKDNPQWETFDGWSFDLPDKLTTQPAQPQQRKSLDVLLPRKNLVATSIHSSSEKQHYLDISAETEDTSNETFSSSEHSFQASDDYEPLYQGFGLDFLKRIASEKVRYETDSDADDSWAQECASEMESSTVYSATSFGPTYDPARIALRELVFNKRLRRHITLRHALVEAPTDEYEYDQDTKENHSGNDLVEEGGSWTAFAPSPIKSDNSDRVSL